MNDIVAGLAVAAVTAVAVAGIFLWTARARREKIEALRALCAQRGWRYAHESGALRRGHAIEGDGWAFAAVSSAEGRETGPGSSDWSHSSRWQAAREDPGRSTFVLGSRLGGSLDVSRVPPALLSRFLGEEVVGMRPFPAGERLQGRFVLFAREAPPPMGVLAARSEDLLLAWPERLPLVVRSSPAHLSLTVLHKRLESPGEIARFIELGESFLGG